MYAERFYTIDTTRTHRMAVVHNYATPGHALYRATD